MNELTIPSADLVSRALEEVNPEPYACKYIYPAIGAAMAGHTYVEAGLSLAWEMAVYDALKGRELPGIVGTVLSLQKDDYLAAIKAICA